MKICNRVRNGLLAADEVAELREHLESCPDCARFAERARAVRRALREHHGRIEPDQGFAARVAARTRTEPSQMLGWAALRLLPATVAVVVVLGWFAARPMDASSQTVAVDSGTSDELLSWVLEDSGAER